jgi:hypothetical protein
VLQYFGDSGDMKNNIRWRCMDTDEVVRSTEPEHWQSGEYIYDQYNDARKALYHKIYNAGWDEKTWWLRSPGIHVRPTTVMIGEKGELFICGADVYMTDIGVRPALWLSL